MLRENAFASLRFYVFGCEINEIPSVSLLDADPDLTAQLGNFGAANRLADPPVKPG
ncbi:MAG TPA: hypothetical protein VIT91_09675 [Chthoniobacterales bacterium]